MKNSQPIEQVHARLAQLVVDAAAAHARIDQALERISPAKPTAESFSREQLERWAFQDALTSLPNRRALAIAARRVTPGWRTWVAIDLDGFKRAQDQEGRGHAWGDGVLRAFAAHLRSVVRVDGEFAIARIGGDEFVVIVDHPRAAERVAELARAWRHEDVGASAGVGRTRREADRALYVAKRARKAGQTWAEIEADRLAGRGLYSGS